jgi:hypothetical protein
MSAVKFAGIALLAVSPLWVTIAPAAPAKLTAAEVVERNLAARGGPAAWHAVQTLSWSGKMEAGGNNQPKLNIPGMPPPAAKQPTDQIQLPFTLEMQRGRKSRLEIVFNGQTAVQVYDGTQGWKRRPFLNRPGAEPFTPEELSIAANQADLDGTLIDYAAKGTQVDLEGTEAVEGKQAYKLKLTLKSGEVRREWIDAKSFLEVKTEGTPRRLDKKVHAVSVYLRDYHAEAGLQIPHVIETVVDGVPRTEKIYIEKVSVNPPLDAARFAKPT